MPSLAVLAEAASIGAASLGLPSNEAASFARDDAAEPGGGDRVELELGLSPEIEASLVDDAGDPRLPWHGAERDECELCVAADKRVSFGIKARDAWTGVGDLRAAEDDPTTKALFAQLRQQLADERIRPGVDSDREVELVVATFALGEHSGAQALGAELRIVGWDDERADRVIPAFVQRGQQTGVAERKPGIFVAGPGEVEQDDSAVHGHSRGKSGLSTNQLTASQIFLSTENIPRSHRVVSSPMTGRPQALLELESTLDAHILRNRVRSAPPLCIADRYRLEKMLGTGAFGVVLCAHDLVLGRKVALKCIPTSDPYATRDCFAGEAQAQTSIRASEIVTVYDFLPSHISSSRGRLGFLAVVMEYVDAQNLRDWARGAAPLEQRLAVLASAARGLEAAHAVGVIHRDFKPENVLVTRDASARLVDFGLAYRVGLSTKQTALARRGTFGLGTLEYMAPEQLEGQAGPRSDQYAFAITAWELLTGTRPFANSSTQLARRGSARDYSGSSRLSRPVLKALGRAMNPDPGERFDTLADLRGALEGAGGTLERIVGVLVGTAAIGALAATAYHAGREQNVHNKG